MGWANWFATIAHLPGAVTQASRLDLLPGRLADVATLLTGDPIDAEQISLAVRVGETDARDIKDLE